MGNPNKIRFGTAHQTEWDAVNECKNVIANSSGIRIPKMAKRIAAFERICKRGAGGEMKTAAVELLEPVTASILNFCFLTVRIKCFVSTGRAPPALS